MTATILLPAGRHEAAGALAGVAGTLGSGEDVVLVAAGLVVAEAALAPLTQDQFAPTSLLVRSAQSGGNVRVRHHVVTSAGSEFHQVAAADHVSVGAVRIAGVDSAVAASAVRELAGLVAAGAIPTDGRDLVELVAVCLVRSGISVRAVPMVDVAWFRDPVDADDARTRASEVTDERIARLQANRLDDGFYSTFVVRKLSKPLTRAALRLGLSPNSVTLVSFAIGLAAAAAFAAGGRGWLVLGAILLQLSLIVDCVDGEVARATRRFSALGAWLDASTDRVKEFLAYAGLAAGAWRSGGDDIWWLALVLVVLQTTRHMSDYDFSRVQRMREAYVPPRDLSLADDGAGAAAAGWSVGSAMELSARVNRRDAVRWGKRAIHMPIGERWLVISVFAAVLGAGWALGTLLVLTALAFCYVELGRVLRTLTWSGPTPAAGGVLLQRQSGAGPLAGGIGAAIPLAVRTRLWESRFAWAVPAALRALELGVVACVALAWLPAAAVAAFWWMAVVAFHHYDVLYRALAGFATPRWIVWGSLGWDGRTLVVVVLAATGLAVAWLGWAALLLALLVVVAASIQWLAMQNAAAAKGAR